MDSLMPSGGHRERTPTSTLEQVRRLEDPEVGDPDERNRNRSFEHFVV